MRLSPIVIAAVISAIAPSFAGEHKAKPAPSPIAVAPQKIPNTDAYFPVAGESQAECKKQYDDPDRVEQNSDGTQTWVYVFGKGKLFIPMGAFFSKLTMLRIDFDPAGKVVKWSTSQQKAI
jgi:hypothetical protein